MLLWFLKKKENMDPINKINDANLYRSEALCSYDLEGSLIKAGKIKKRLVFSCDLRIVIRAKSHFSESFVLDGVEPKYVKFRIMDSTIYLKVKDLINRLHISENKLHKLIKNETLEIFIVEQANKLTEILNTFESLLTKKTLSNHCLMMIATESHKALKEANSLSTKFSLKNDCCVAIRDENKKLIEIFTLQQSTLARGGYSDIYRAHNLQTHEEFILKLPNETSLSKEESQNSCEIRAKIHKEGTLEGIEPPPRNIVVLSNIPQYKQGTIEHFYNFGSLRQVKSESYEEYGFMNLTVRQIIKLWQKPIHSLKNIGSKGIVHSDIKLANILLKEDYNGDLQIILADWGGAKDLSNLSEDNLKSSYRSFNDLLGITTTTYVPFNFLQAGKEAFLKGDVTELKRIMSQIDVFQMAIAIYESIIPDSPIIRLAFDPLSPSKKYCHVTDFEPLREVAPPIFGLLNDMSSTNKNRQPTIIEICERLDQILVEWTE